MRIRYYRPILYVIDAVVAVLLIIFSIQSFRKAQSSLDAATEPVQALRYEVTRNNIYNSSGDYYGNYSIRVDGKLYYHMEILKRDLEDLPKNEYTDAYYNPDKPSDFYTAYEKEHASQVIQSKMKNTIIIDVILAFVLINSTIWLRRMKQEKDDMKQTIAQGGDVVIKKKK